MVSIKGPTAAGRSVVLIRSKNFALEGDLGLLLKAAYQLFPSSYTL